jgi:hypothetical protein
MNGHLIWWSTNTRACSVLAYASKQLRVPTCIVLDPEVKAPSNEVLRSSFIIKRDRKSLDVGELESILKKFVETTEVDSVFIAPTSEYIQHFIHSLDDPPKSLSSFPFSTASYSELSSKQNLKIMFDNYDIAAANTVNSVQNSQLYVAKPKNNIVDNLTLKPFLVNDSQSRSRFKEKETLFFLQEYLAGPSMYFCAFRDFRGITNYIWQQNMLQEKSGGSIALAQVAADESVFEKLSGSLCRFLEDVDYCGPFMVEFRGAPMKAIEINPRFWGPLALSASSRSGILNSYFKCMGFSQSDPDLLFPYSNEYLVPSLIEESVASDLTMLASPSAVSSRYEVSTNSHFLAQFMNDRAGGEW